MYFLYIALNPFSTYSSIYHNNTKVNRYRALLFIQYSIYYRGNREVTKKHIMQSKTKTPKTCPRCLDEYTNPPALSRRDNETEICPHCGHEEALYDFAHSKGGVNTTLPLEVYSREATFRNLIGNN